MSIGSAGPPKGGYYKLHAKNSQLYKSQLRNFSNFAINHTKLLYVASATFRFGRSLTSFVAIRPATFGRNITSKANGRYHAT